MNMHSNEQSPEYNFTAREIELANSGSAHVLERDYLETRAPAIAIQPAYLDPAESARQGVAGSGYNEILDFDHSQDEAMWALNAANSYAARVIRRVDQMYEEAYAANAYPDGPDQFFAHQTTERARRNHKPGVIARILGKLSISR